MKHDAWRAAIAVGRTQHGVICNGQFRQLGFSSERVRTRVRRGDLVGTLPGVWRFASAQPTKLQSLWSAMLWSKHGVVCANSAAQLWAFEGVHAQHAHIMVPNTVNPRHASVLVRRVQTIDLADVRHRDGLTVATPELTIIQLSGELKARDFEVAFESARRLRLVTVESVHKTLERVGSSGRRGTRELQVLLSELKGTAACDSVLEVDTARLLRDHHIEAPSRQHPVTAFGKRYFVDFAWPHRRVFLECFGRNPHDDPARWAADYDRLSALAAATGWTPIVTTWTEVHRHPTKLVAKLDAALRGHGQTGPNHHSGLLRSGRATQTSGALNERTRIST